MRCVALVCGVLASLISSPALALEPRQCLPMAEMNAALRAEGQRTLIIGNRVALRNDATRESGLRVQGWVNTFTSNDDGSVGYNLEGDRPVGQPSTRVCVAGKFTNIRLYDARRPGVPPAALRGGPFDDFLRRNERNGIRPMLQADAISAGPNSEARRGNVVTLEADVARGEATLFLTRPDGRSESLLLMNNVAYTPAGLERLD